MAYGFGRMVLAVWLLGVWFWAHGFGCLALGVSFGFGRMVLGVWFWVDGFGHMALGIWFGFGHMVLGIWFCESGFGGMVRLWGYGLALGAWFWAYGFGCMIFGAQPCKREQAKLKSIYRY